MKITTDTLSKIEELLRETDEHYNASIAREVDDEYWYREEDEDDKEYNLYWDCVVKVGEIIHEETNGEIDILTATRMAVHNRNDFLRLLARCAK